MARTCRESCALMPMIARSERDQGNDVGSEELAVGLAVRSPVQPRRPACQAGRAPFDSMRSPDRAYRRSGMRRRAPVAPGGS